MRLSEKNDNAVNNSRPGPVGTDNSQFFVMGKNRIKIVEHFTESGKPLANLMEDMIHRAAVAS